MKELGSEVAGGGKDSEQTQPKTKNPIVRTGRLVNSSVPVSVERSDKDKDAHENADADHVRTGRPVEREQSIGLFTQCEEIYTDFRVSRLPHAVVTQAENFRVRELVKKIESHPHRHTLQSDLQQNNAYNPLSDELKAMIREMGNVEVFELCETIPKVQCSECLLYWNQGKVYCICGHLLKESESSRHLHQWHLDVLSIPNYVIKKERPHGARHGKTEVQKEHFIAQNARRRCIKKSFQGIHDRFQKDIRFRDTQLKVGRTEERSIEMDELAQKDFTYRPSPEELEIKENLVYLPEHIWQKCTDETPFRLQRNINKIAPSSP